MSAVDVAVTCCVTCPSYQSNQVTAVAADVALAMALDWKIYKPN